MANEKIMVKLEKGRAEFAYKCVLDAKERVFSNNKEKQKDYKSYVRKIPAMILSNGLGQTLAFVKAKSDKGNAYELIYKQITEYLKSEHPTRIRMPNEKNELVEWVITRDSVNYKYITKEVLAFLNWLRRFAEGLIEGEKE